MDKVGHALACHLRAHRGGPPAVRPLDAESLRVFAFYRFSEVIELTMTSVDLVIS